MSPLQNISIVMLASALVLGACQERSDHRRAQLNEEISELRSQAQGANSEEITKLGERALEIADEAAIAEGLANDGLENLSVDSFEQSLMFFEMALAKDRGNEKALFYLSLLRPFRSLRGFAFQWNLLTEPGSPSPLAYLFMLPDDNPEYALLKFIYTPVENPVRSIREGVKKIVAPFLEELRGSIADLAILLTNPTIDLQVNMPKDLAIISKARVRGADLRVLRAIYIYFYVIGKITVAYQPAEIIEGANTDEQRLAKMMNDPAFGVLSDPLIFEEIRKDGLDLLEALSLGEEELSARFIGLENSVGDLFQVDHRQVVLCRKWSAFGLRPTEAQSDGKTLVCNSTEYQSRSFLTQLNSPERAQLQKLQNGSMIETPMEAEAYNELVNSSTFDSKVIRGAIQRFRSYLLGPVEVDIICGASEDKPVKEKVWVDFPGFAKRPLKDLKKLEPRFFGGLEIDDVYSLKDSTLGGLFKPGYPCYQQREEMAKRRGLAVHSHEYKRAEASRSKNESGRLHSRNLVGSKR